MSSTEFISRGPEQLLPFPMTRVALRWAGFNSPIIHRFLLICPRRAGH